VRGPTEAMATPVVCLSATLAVYLLLCRLQTRLADHPRMQLLANPIAGTVALIAVLLWATALPYEVYFDGARLLHALLGPSTVALAIPLYEQRRRIRTAWRPIAAALAAGCVTAAVSAWTLAAALGAPPTLLRSFAPKSVTTAIAVSLSETMGGLPAVTAATVLITGIVGAMLLLPLLDLLRVRHPEARGFALGLAAHGVGTARAFQLSNEMGAFAGLAVGLNGALTSVVIPMMLPLLGGP
jgi:predicted murein hydrolase (TIGR00659 family)